MNKSTAVRHHGHHHHFNIPELLRKTGAWIKKFVSNNTVLVIAATLAVISCFFVKPDAEYIGYFDFKTLTCLFCTLAVICALKNIRFFTITARKIVKCAGNTRTLTLALVYITFIGAIYFSLPVAVRDM